MHEQAYTWLLRLYPERFRADYGEEALLLFRDRLSHEQGVVQRVRLWLDIFCDLVSSLYREHRDAAVAGSMPEPVRRPTGPCLHLVRQGLPVRHLLLGVMGSMVLYGVLPLAMPGERIEAEPYSSNAARRGSASRRGPEAGKLQVAAQAGNVTIQGTVRAAPGGEPVADAWIAVAPLGPDGGRPAGTPATPPLPDTATDGNGRFEIRGLFPGSYRLIVMASGYVRQDYHRTVTVAAGQPVQNVSIQMVPAGSVSGRIQDIAGRPLAGVNVTLLRRAYKRRWRACLKAGDDQEHQ